MTTQRMHSNAFKILTLAGIVGASLALLFAPRSGKETRQKIRVATTNMKHRAGNKLETAKHSMEDQAHAALEMKNRAEQAISAGKLSAQEKYQELRDQKATSGMDESMPSDLVSNNEEEV